MALCSSQLDSAMPQIKRDDSSEPEGEMSATASPEGSSSQDNKPNLQPNPLYGLNPGALPLSVDYRSPVSHFIPPAVEMYNANKPEIISTDASESPSTPAKRKRGRPRVDKTSPEYLAKSAARKQAKEMAAVLNNSGNSEGGEKRKRGRPRVDKTSPEYLARKRARELEALEKKAKRQYKRRGTGAKMLSSKTAILQTRVLRRSSTATPRSTKTKLVRKVTTNNGGIRKVVDKKVVMRRNGKFVKRKVTKKDSAASSSTGDTTPRVKRKYTKRALSAGGNGPGRPRKDPNAPSSERVKGKRGRPRKTDLMAGGMMASNSSTQGKIRVRSNLMPMNSEPISLDSDDEPDLGSPSQASDSLSLDENLRALRHLHEKYANLDKDDAYNAQLLAANCKKNERGSEDRSVIELDTRVEKLEDSSNSDSDSSSSASGSGSSSSSSSGSSSSSSGSESDSDDERNGAPPPIINDIAERSLGAWSHASQPTSDSDSDPERAAAVSPAPGAVSPARSLSESENESPDKSFQCHVCRKWYSTSVTLKIHRRSHQRTSASSSRSRNRSSSRYDCDCCAMTFTRREKLYEHKAEAHRGQMTVRCEVCRKCFEDEAELAAHDREHTADERAGRCSTCGAQFPSHSALAKHRLTHGSPATHSCPQCAKGFSHAHSLTRHLQNHARQLYKCVVCKASFARADQLAQHLNSHLANYKRLKP
ncbi:myoneurin isoform X3 [Plutella xylostella]|nr:myoneurin isoform X1 [Plutella xylostella]XP_048479831.1 myoneurin isoform X3 [Plutella xylostella]